MPGRTIAPSHRLVSASKLIDTVAESLSVIKEQDGLTDAELGAVMHKGVDQGAKYRAGLAEMGMVAFLRAAERWNGRFANEALALLGMKLVTLDDGAVLDRSSATCLTRLLLEMSTALEDGKIENDELHAMRRTIEDAGAMIDRMRERLALRAA